MIALTMVMALGLGACGDDDDETAQTTETTAAQVRGSDLVTIEMADFTFNVSGPLTAGGTLRVSNTGQEFHMMSMSRLRPGKSLQDVQAALAQMGEGGPGGGGGGGGGGEETTTTAVSGTSTTRARGATTTTVGGATTSTAAGGDDEADPFADIFEGETGLPGAFMSPGESAEVMVTNLQPGTYALLCFIPTEGEGPPHIAKGMINELQVVAGTPPPQPTADATYKLAPGKAIEGPTTLTPGKHTLKFEAAPGSHQLEPSISRLNRGTTLAQLDRAFTELFESDAPPPKGAGRQAPGQVVFGGFDLHDVTSFYLTVDLKAADYVLVAEDTDAEDTPSPPKELLNLKVA